MAEMFRNYTSSPQLLNPEVNRQRQTADMLRRQSMQPMQGQSVSGHYVAPSWTEGLNKLFSGYASGQLDQMAGETQQRQRSELSNALRTPETIPQGIRDPNYQPPQLAERLSDLRDNPQAQEMAMQLRMREATQGPGYQTIPSQQAQQMGLGDGVWQISPDGQISRAYEPERPDYNQAVITGPDGQPMPNQAYIDAQSRIRAAGRDGGVSIDFGNMMGGAPELGKLSTDYGYKLDQSGRPIIGEDGLPIASPVPGSKAAQEIEQRQQQAQGRDQQTRRAGSTVIQDLNRALELVDELPSITQGENPVAGAITGVMANIPRTTANQITQFTESALSNVGLDTLQTMRENSPTGGALGQVPIQQQKRLEQVLGSLEINQPPNVLKDNLKRVMNIYTDIVEGTPEERARAVREGRMTQEQSDQVDQMYMPLSFDERGRPIDDQESGDSLTEEERQELQMLRERYAQ